MDLYFVDTLKFDFYLIPILSFILNQLLWTCFLLSHNHPIIDQILMLYQLEQFYQCLKVFLLKQIFLNIYSNNDEVFKNMKKQTCEGRKLKSISDELYKRLILPLYTLIISLIAASLIIEPKSKYFSKFHKINIFIFGSFIIIVSQISLKFLLNSIGMIYFVFIEHILCSWMNRKV